MLLDTLLELAGGINNVTRILAPQGQVVLALKHPPHAPHLPDDVSLQSVLGEWQLSVQRTAEVSDQQLAAIGKAIAERQKRATLPYQTALDCPYRPSGISHHHRAYSTTPTALFIIKRNTTSFINGILSLANTKINTGCILRASI